MLGDLTPDGIEQVLKKEPTGRIGYTSNGKVFIVPITFAYDGEYIYGHSLDGLKIRAMRANPNICFEVDIVKDLANWKSVVIHGEYQELLGEQARKAMQFFIEELKPYLVSSTSIPSHGLGHFHLKETSEIKSIVYRIKIHEKTGKFEKQE